jgi:hypothetical protein
VTISPLLQAPGQGKKESLEQLYGNVKLSTKSYLLLFKVLFSNMYSGLISAILDRIIATSVKYIPIFKF